MQAGGAARFVPGEMALVLDPTGKRYLICLADQDTLHHHLGTVQHADIIGQLDGARVRSSQGRVFTVVRPRLIDAILEMPRKSGIVYPKDAAHLLAWADVAPGQRVLESGVGSGALTLALLRAVGERGQVIGYEVRSDFLELALSNVHAQANPRPTNLLLREHDIYTGIPDQDFDRVVLDLPEPWRVVPHVRAALKPGGWLAAYTPSIVQAGHLVETVRATGRFVQIETNEVLLRGWHIQGQAVRPEHEMVGHTGFVNVARLVGEL
ncbi:MAG: tRNA (adenine-N1)-methyltransferase [Chloroflexi bacterium]|nr:tRNA (adenine-N1)-methyltransferase [Chloroflexota bacterium]MBV9596528.1 tRNA (adenine-N1)-methyltransferase [Chloroflexota bacterium]